MTTARERVEAALKLAREWDMFEAKLPNEFAQALLQGWLTMHDAMAEWTKDEGFECGYLIYDALASARKKLEGLK